MKEKILKIIQASCALEEDINIDSKIDAISIDSLTFVEAIIKIEEEFGVEFDLELLDMRKWETVYDIIVMIEGMCDGKANCRNKTF